MVLPALLCHSFAVLWLVTTIRAAPSDPLAVQLTSGAFRGLTVPNGTDRWLGIPFAHPPVGSLRFKAPVAITTPSKTVQDAFSFGDACPQPAPTPPSTLNAPVGEDCLFLNVWRPSNVPVTANLPVLVWFYGGAYTTGAASDPTFDPTRIVQRSAATGKPILFVSVNYRVNTFGFSAGAGSAEAHILFPAEETLFRAAIFDSSTGPFKTDPPASQYDDPGFPTARLLAATGCPAGPESIACLQRVPFETFMDISNVMINDTLNQQFLQPSVGPIGSFVTERPSQRLASGNYLRVPVLAGTNLNEGTKFSQAVFNLSVPPELEVEVFDQFINALFIDPSTISQSTLDQIHELYPANDSSLGGAFNTGDSLFDRAEAWYTDNMFLSPRRRFFDKAASTQKLFGYFFTEFIPGNDPSLGVFHGSELALLFGPVPTPVEDDFANQLTDFYINFVNDMDPGSPWPQFTPESRNLLQLMRNNITVIPDDFLQEKTSFLNSEKVLAEFQK
ncbi:hypothetical protein CERSUDRAFT_90791 [Gelatoporia subvermispora B]|uniref:Carboxylesterase type B domain-containing protein n=1 Tax=Ceriporiopsis subvermispora (strain B) TaxID=914234 RepID=M2QYF5_CERS8|nr:hypothetical protein CERSUDRAFT_90791 [Gelatoporia subvermispora B]